MILISSIVLFLALFLEGIVTSIFNFFSPHFLLITLLLIYPLFLDRKKTYLFLLLISTVFYDLLYTNILFLNTICIFCIYLFMEKNVKTGKFFYFIGYYFFYHLILFSCFYVVGYIKSPFVFLEVLLMSSIPDFIYAMILYFCIQKFYPNREKKYSYLHSYS